MKGTPSVGRQSPRGLVYIWTWPDGQGGDRPPQNPYSGRSPLVATRRFNSGGRAYPSQTEVSRRTNG